MANTLNKITTKSILDATVATADIADDAVTLAKMAAGTDGQIITYDASGNPTAVGPGTDGQVLTSTGAGSPPAFEAIPTQISLANDANNRVITGTGSGLNGEANLTFDGTDLATTGRIAGGGAAFSDATAGHDDLVLKTSGSTGMTIVSGDTSNGTIAFADGTSGNAFYRSYLQYNHNTDLMSVGVGGGTMMEWTNANVKINDGNLVIGTAGHGIDFSATNNGSGTTTAELLDDYEYGSFTPIIDGSGGAGTVGYSAQNGFYIKIGRLVTVYVDFTVSSWSGASGNQRIGGFPFTKNELSSQAYYYEGVSTWYVENNLTNSKANYTGYFGDGAVHLNMYVGDTVQTDSAAPINVTGRASFTFTYSTSA